MTKKSNMVAAIIITILGLAAILVFNLSVIRSKNAGQTLVDQTCSFRWAQEVLPDLSREFELALKKIQPQAVGYAEAYGENCVNPDGVILRFVAMQTDFHITLEVKDLTDKATLGKYVEKLLDILEHFPPESTPGPNAGYIGITFKTQDDQINLWLPISKAQSALKAGLQNEALFNRLRH